MSQTINSMNLTVKYFSQQGLLPMSFAHYYVPWKTLNVQCMQSIVSELFILIKVIHTLLVLDDFLVSKGLYIISLSCLSERGISLSSSMVNFDS